MSTSIKGGVNPLSDLELSTPQVAVSSPPVQPILPPSTMPTTVITGARTGLGLQHVRHLAPSPTSTIYALVRSLNSSDLTALRTLQSTSPATIRILEGDTSSPASISALPALIASTSPTPEPRPPFPYHKAALNMMTLHQAKQVPRGVVVDCVDPGHVRTEMGREGATVEVGESVRGIWQVVAGLGEGDGGRFFAVGGGGVPW